MALIVVQALCNAYTMAKLVDTSPDLKSYSFSEIEKGVTEITVFETQKNVLLNALEVKGIEIKNQKEIER